SGRAWCGAPHCASISASDEGRDSIVRLRLRRGALVAVCALLALAALTGRAQAGPAPEAPPHPQGGSLKPDPGPGTAKPAITTTPSSSSVSSYVPSFQRAAAPAATVPPT